MNVVGQLMSFAVVIQVIEGIYCHSWSSHTTLSVSVNQRRRISCSRRTSSRRWWSWRRRWWRRRQNWRRMLSWLTAGLVCDLWKEIIHPIVMHHSSVNLTSRVCLVLRRDSVDSIMLRWNIIDRDWIRKWGDDVWSTSWGMNKACCRMIDRKDIIRGRYVSFVTIFQYVQSSHCSHTVGQIEELTD